MARRISVSQMKSQLRQLERKQKKAIDDYNRAVRNYNNEIKKQVNNYNRFVREYNSAVRRNRQIVNRELRKLNMQSSLNVSYASSLNNMNQYYSRVNSIYHEGADVTPEQNRILDLVEQEHANSIITANLLENDVLPEEDTADIELGNKLLMVSEDLHNRWKGAVFSLSPSNPDAARHFCTSAREIFTEFIEQKAPDEEVFLYNPCCKKTDRGNATRQEKIKYMMRNMEFDESVCKFADANIDNILELFYVLSNGTHGEAGKYDLKKLLQVKKRVEQGINFLCEISA